MDLSSGAKVAVIGSGVAGIVSAYLLQNRYQVTLYEADNRLGGHTNTVKVTSGPDCGIGVDTGFIVLNDKTYPLFHRFLDQLGVPVRWSDMSFSYESRASGFCYAGTDLNGLFANRSNFLRPKFYRFLAEILRFCREGTQLIEKNSSDPNLSLGDFLSQRKFTRTAINCYVLPMAAAIWSAPFNEILKFPASSIFRFFSNHGLLSLFSRPRWQTVEGGSQAYVQKFASEFRGDIKLEAPVLRVASEQGKLRVSAGNNDDEIFDAVVFACHADQTYQMLNDPSPQERLLLGSWRYQKNLAVLHTDPSFLPRTRRAWASWNFISADTADTRTPVEVTYYMNRLQGLNTVRDYCVTLNPTTLPSQEQTIAQFLYEHPIFDSESCSTQSKLNQLQGVNGKYFCGSYFGYGFHEDAVRSAVEVGRLLRVEL